MIYVRGRVDVESRWDSFGWVQREWGEKEGSVKYLQSNAKEVGEEKRERKRGKEKKRRKRRLNRMNKRKKKRGHTPGKEKEERVPDAAGWVITRRRMDAKDGGDCRDTHITVVWGRGRGIDTE